MAREIKVMTTMRNATNRKKAMTAIIGLWRDREDIGDTQEYIRELRQGTGKRLRRIRVHRRSSAAQSLTKPLPDF